MRHSRINVSPLSPSRAYQIRVHTMNVMVQGEEEVTWKLRWRRRGRGGVQEGGEDNKKEELKGRKMMGGRGGKEAKEEERQMRGGAGAEEIK